MIDKQLRRRGIVLLSPSLILEWLHFDGGDITGATYNRESRSVELVIEHPDMPDVPEGGVVGYIVPEYRECEYFQRGGIGLVERISPKRTD